MMKNQTLSELIDGELSPDEMEAALDSVLANPELQKSWHHLHTVRSVIKGEEMSTSSDIVARVADALDDEPTIMAPDNLRQENAASDRSRENVIQIGAKRNRVLAYAAIAASFAAIVMVSYSPEKAEIPTIADSSTTTSSIGASSEAFQMELQSMVVQHGEFSGAAALNGLVAYAKVVNGTTNGATR